MELAEVKQNWVGPVHHQIWIVSKYYEILGKTMLLNYRRIPKTVKKTQVMILNSPLNEGGVSTLRVLELIPGFWSCSQGFGIDPRVLELLLGFWSCSQGFGVLLGFWSCSQGFGVLLGFWSCSQGFGVAPGVLELLPGIWSKV